MWRYEPDSEQEYVGNVWGWKFSAFGAGLIAFMLLLAFIIAQSRGRSVFDNGSTPIPTERVER